MVSLGCCCSSVWEVVVIAHEVSSTTGSRDSVDLGNVGKGERRSPCSLFRAVHGPNIWSRNQDFPTLNACSRAPISVSYLPRIVV